MHFQNRDEQVNLTLWPAHPPGIFVENLPTRHNAPQMPRGLSPGQGKNDCKKTLFTDLEMQPLLKKIGFHLFFVVLA